MSANHDLYLDLVAASAVGSIEPRDQALLEEHLAGGCAVCHALLRDLAAPVEALARSVPAAKPSRGLKARTMVAIAGGAGVAAAGAAASASEAGAAPTPGGRGLPWSLAAGLLLCAALGWWRWSVASGQRDDLRAHLAVCEARCPPTPAAEDEFARFVAAHPGARTIPLAPTPKGDATRRVQVAYDPGTRRALVRFENFRAPTGKDFELWTIRDGKASSEGLVRVDADGRGLKVLENTGDPAQLQAFAVSLEAAGGARDRQKPSDEVHFAGAAS